MALILVLLKLAVALVVPGPEVSPAPAPPSSSNPPGKRNGRPVSAPPHQTQGELSPPNQYTTKGSFLVLAPSSSSHTAQRSSKATTSTSLPPYKLPPSEGFHSMIPSPSTLFFGHHNRRNKVHIIASVPSSRGFAPASKQPGAGPDLSATPVPPSQRNHQRNYGIPVAAPPHELLSDLPPPNHSTTEPFIPGVAPSSNVAQGHPDASSAPLPTYKFNPIRGFHSPVSSSPPALFHGHHRGRKNINSPASAPTSLGFIPASKQDSRTRWLAPSSHNSVNTSPFSLPRSVGHAGPPPLHPPVPAPAPSDYAKIPFALPGISTPGSRNSNTPLLPPLQAVPPPPPNEDCASTVCYEPLTNTPPGSPCGCVIPMQVELRLSIELLTFFPLVSELAMEISTGVFMKEIQIRIIGANAATQQPDKTIVLVDLVPLGETFDNTTAFLTYQRFWQKQVVINTSFFGDYEVLYVRYPGLPTSSPLAASDIADDGPNSGHGSNDKTIQPLAVDIPKNQHKSGLSGGMIAIMVLSPSIVIVLCYAAARVFFKHRGHFCETFPNLEAFQPSLTRPAGSMMLGSNSSSASLSYVSSNINYAGSTKTFSLNEIERATDNFNPSRILGEGGFGRVYGGVLLDGTKVAVKVLKRDDQQGAREFLAEVEMLSRLHHRNLVKLIAICIEDRACCLVYELIPNGSVESHLHGVDKEIAPLDWNARIKIALGAARGLAYLHEDSSPPVIHRDFKSSNILLEHDFVPKVSDFGLARTAMDGENSHISTRVMGTFGYVAPEYAMTGHLLVKSDVYSYGVVLLELLTGRRPIDMTQPIGQENLVTWARPLLSSKETLETIVDPSLGPNYPLNSVAKVAAIASMCVQPEVSHRPFMGEVVQALKLVCNECEETKEVGSIRCSIGDLSMDLDIEAPSSSDHLPYHFPPQYSAPHFDSGSDPEVGLTASVLFSTSDRAWRHAPGSFRLGSSSEPLMTGRTERLWQAIRSLSQGIVSEHSRVRSWPRSH